MKPTAKSITATTRQKTNIMNLLHIIVNSRRKKKKPELVCYYISGYIGTFEVTYLEKKLKML